MKKIKARFQDDPAFAVTVMFTGALVATAVLKGIANVVTSSAYAYRASKLV